MGNKIEIILTTNITEGTIMKKTLLSLMAVTSAGLLGMYGASNQWNNTDNAWCVDDSHCGSDTTSNNDNTNYEDTHHNNWDNDYSSSWDDAQTTVDRSTDMSHINSISAEMAQIEHSTDNNDEQ